MSTQFTFKKCLHHGQSKFIRKAPSHVVHGFLSLLTLGLWVPVWLLSSFQIGGWQCEHCGSAPLGESKRSRGTVGGFVILGILLCGLSALVLYKFL